jgi:hypothetical protein
MLDLVLVVRVVAGLGVVVRVRVRVQRLVDQLQDAGVEQVGPEGPDRLLEDSHSLSEVAHVYQAPVRFIHSSSSCRTTWDMVMLVRSVCRSRASRCSAVMRKVARTSRCFLDFLLLAVWAPAVAIGGPPGCMLVVSTGSNTFVFE